jgi:hypothetical protein
MLVDTSRASLDLDSLLSATMSSPDDEVRHAASLWIDLVAKGRNLGRSVLHRETTLGFVDLDAQQITLLAHGPHQVVAVPPLVPPMGG